jgi:N6-adenosine-specific RNA methylase IME4
MTWALDPLEPGAYRTIVCDPPWRYAQTERLGARGRRRASPGAYSSLTPGQLAALPVGDLVDQSGHCWLWTTNAVLAAGRHRSVLEAWGFRPLTVVTWCKSGAGLGKYLRSTTEHAVLAVKGWGTVPEVPATSTWWQWERGAHSVKPPGFGDLVERVSPGPYVELFARQQRLGWSSWGLGYEIGATA